MGLHSRCAGGRRERNKRIGNFVEKTETSFAFSRYQKAVQYSLPKQFSYVSSKDKTKDVAFSSPSPSRQLETRGNHIKAPLFLPLFAFPEFSVSSSLVSFLSGFRPEGISGLSTHWQSSIEEREDIFRTGTHHRVA